MKTYKEFIQLNQYPHPNTNKDSIDENFRTVAGVGLMLKSKNLNSRLKQITIRPTDSQLSQLEKLSQKIDLLSDQLIAATYVTSSLGIMK